MRRALAALLAGLCLGCGYHFAGVSKKMPSAKSVSIELFRNRTREHGIEIALRRALEDEFRRRGALTVVPPPEGDLVLTGRIRRFGTTPVAFTGTSEAVQFQGVIQIAFRLLDRSSGQVLYENKLLQESLDFGATSGVLVTSSPRFQRGTIDARDLTNMTNAQIGEGRRRDALTELLDLLARDVYLQAMEGF